MKKRLLAILGVVILVTGCSKNSVDEPVMSAVTIADSTDDTNAVEENSADSDSASVVESSENLSDKSTNESTNEYSNICITRYSCDSEIICEKQDSFYTDFAAIIIDNYLKCEGDDIETISALWDEQISVTNKNLEGALNDEEKDELTKLIACWDSFKADYLAYINSIYGLNGAVPGSMYKEMAPSLVESEYELIAGMLMSINYHVGGNIYAGTLSETEISEVNKFDYSNNLLCLEDSDDFHEFIEEYEIDNLGYDDLTQLLLEKMSYLGELSGKKPVGKQLAEEYIELVENMYEIENAVFDDTDRCEAVKRNRIKVLLLQVLNSEYLLALN